MAVLSLNRTWRIMKENKEHELRVKLSNRGIHVQFEVLVDDRNIIDKKASDLNELWDDYEVDLDGSSLVLSVFKKGQMGLATEVELYHEDQLVPQESLFTLPAVADTGKKDNKTDATSDRPGAMIPKLPSNCSACGAPVSMQNVEWVGPLSAQCSRCASAIEVEWQKLG